MSHSVYRLLLIDPDPIFRFGMQAWLNPLPDLDLVAEADTAQKALQILAGSEPLTEILERSSGVRPQPLLPVDLVVLGFSLNSDPSLLNATSALKLCQQIKALFPALPILVVGFPKDVDQFSVALQHRIEGYCLKGQSLEELAAAMQRVASGQTYWSNDVGQSLYAADQTAVVFNRPAGVWAVVKQNLCWSGLRYIDAALDELQTEQEAFGPSDAIAKAILAGRRRELNAARWVVNRLWQTGKTRQWNDWGEQDNWSAQQGDRQDDRQGLARFNDSDRRPMNPKTIELNLFNTTVTRIQDNLVNLTSTTLEIDILRDEKKRELLYIVLRQFENRLSELRFSQTQPHQLLEKKIIILGDLWKQSIIDFFGKYYTLNDQKNKNIGVIEILFQDLDFVSETILNKIPQSMEIFSHLLFRTPLIVDRQIYEAGSPEAAYRAQILLDNLLIQVANAVIQPLLNHFSDFEPVKQKFYAYHLITSRDIERFRNNLSWKYRLEKYVAEPQAIFESRYLLLGFTEYGITTSSIYAARTQELQTLQGIRLAVTLALEFQDAIAPRLRSAVLVLGSGVVYFLTNVVGRGIGLIGRGVLQGMGSAWDEKRFKPKGRSQ